MSALNPSVVKIFMFLLRRADGCKMSNNNNKIIKQ